MTVETRPVRENIFISYRRDDARGASGRLYDWLRIGVGRERVFRDVHSIGVGKWRDKIDAALAQSAVCVAVIGPRWANADNLPRLQDERDMVRHELVTALASNELTLVPTLVEGAEVPKTAELPSVLRPLFDTWNARRITEDGWEDDTRRLIAEIAEATRLPVGADLDTLLRDAGAAQLRIAELEQTRHLQVEQIEALHRTVDELRRKLAEAPAGERPAFMAAFAALAQGNSIAAEDAFEREYEEQSRAADRAHQTMAEAARNIANLALMRDVVKAVSFYRKSLEAEPEHAETARLLGQALIQLGDLAGAEAAFSHSLSIATASGDRWGEMAAQIGLGDVFQARGDLTAAKAAFTVALHVTKQCLASNPNTQWQRDLSVSHDRIGDVLVAQGDGPGALLAYRNSLGIAEALAARDPANTQWQRDVSVSHDRIGDVLVAQGDGPGALLACRNSLRIREALAAHDPANTQWQRDVVVSCAKIGVLPHGQNADVRRDYLLRGREIMMGLNEAGSLLANHDWIEWFNAQLEQL
jgi:tetratricopeptide (TPR) repeat protein